MKLKDLRKAGTMMLLLFLLGCVCVIAGTLIGYYVLAPGNYGIEKPHAIAGMIASTYTGGSVNLAAVALHYGMTADGTLFAAINAADNIITTLWIIVTMVLPVWLQRRWPRGTPSVVAPVSAVIAPEPAVRKEEIVLLDLVILLAMGTGSLFAAQLLGRYLPALPAILTLTTVALALAQVPFVQRLQGARALASLTVLLFLAVIGANCDIAALLQNGQVAGMLLAWVTIAVGLHGLFLFAIGAVFRRDWAMLSVVSNAGVGGATTAGVLATAIRRDDLRLPGVLVGAVGNAIGTYIGIFVAEFLR